MQRGWGTPRMQKLATMLDTLPSIPITRNRLTDRYAEIDAFSQGKDTARPLPRGTSARNMSKNDIWIAATASILQYPLITTDHDFNHLHDVFLDVIEIDPRWSERDA